MARKREMLEWAIMVRCNKRHASLTLNSKDKRHILSFSFDSLAAAAGKKFTMSRRTAVASEVTPAIS